MNNYRPTMKQKRAFAERYHVVKTAEPTKPMRSSITIRINIMHPICNAVFGKGHTLAQRLIVGTLVALIGVGVAKWSGHSTNAVVGHLGDMVGYGMHALGLAPFIEWMAERYA